MMQRSVFTVLCPRGRTVLIALLAVGLLAAIPATMAYNAFVARIDAIAANIDLFAGELEADLSRLGDGDAVLQPRAVGE